MKKFSELFKKYRLRAEFETFSSFGDALSEKGYHYEESIFSHWQKGARIPNNRKLILTIIKIFIERDVIQTIDKANEFLSSAGFGYPTDKEIKELNLKQSHHSPFQVPSEISNFAGRKEIISQMTKENIEGKVIHIYGSAGVGKTTLAIKLAHLLRSDFPDGVLWYRMGNISLKEIFISITHLFNQKLPASKNIEVLASSIRSFLSQKRILLILDDVETKSSIHLLLPVNAVVTVLSRRKNIYIPANVIKIPLESFSQKESLSLFENVLGRNYVKKHGQILSHVSRVVGGLPLAVHIFAHQLRQSKINPREMLNSIEKEEPFLSKLFYENKDLYLAINISYKNLSKKAQAVFLSLGVFEGKDFSIEAISYINGLSQEKTRTIIDELTNDSLIEKSIGGKYRTHPVIKKFIVEKLNNPYVSLLNNISFVAFIIYTIYWIIIQMTTSSGMYDRLFSSTYFTVALWGAIWGVKVANKWGGIRSTMGKALLFFSLGLMLQVFGQIVYAYYSIFQKIEIPYPSLGDLGYFGTIPIYIVGVFFLAKVSGIKLGLALIKKHLLAFCLSLGLLVLSFVILLQNYIFDWSYPLKIFLDFIYPIGDWFYFFFAMLIYLELRKAEKNIMKNKILFFVLALFMQTFSDYVFICQANLEIWQGGNINDYMYLISYLMMTLAILRLDSHMTRVIGK